MIVDQRCVGLEVSGNVDAGRTSSTLCKYLGSYCETKAEQAFLYSSAEEAHQKDPNQAW